MHPLYDVAAVVEDAADVFCVDGAGEVGVTVMAPITAGCADPLKPPKTQRYSQVSLLDQCLSSYCLMHYYHEDKGLYRIKNTAILIYF